MRDKWTDHSASGLDPWPCSQVGWSWPAQGVCFKALAPLAWLPAFRWACTQLLSGCLPPGGCLMQGFKWGALSGCLSPGGCLPQGFKWRSSQVATPSTVSGDSGLAACTQVGWSWPAKRVWFGLHRHRVFVARLQVPKQAVTSGEVLKQVAAGCHFQ